MAFPFETKILHVWKIRYLFLINPFTLYVKTKMPANLPPQYFEAEKKLREAKTPQEKLQLVEAMLAIIPHHKGTDKLIGHLRKRLSRLREEAETGSKAGKRGSLHQVNKEGAAQVVMAGLPNAGKSLLLKTLTNAETRVAEYPYTTRIPAPGMLMVDNVQIQLIDLPPIMDESVETWLYNFFRNADMLMLVVDLADAPVVQLELMVEDLQSKRICLEGTPSEDSAGPGDIVKKPMVVGTKADLPGAGEGLREMHSSCGDRLNIYVLSALKGLNLQGLGKELFECLDLVRAYTKVPGKEADREKPYVLPRGSTVKDLARKIHKDLVGKLKYARIWGENKYDGQKVSADHILEDEDVIEIHG